MMGNFKILAKARMEDTEMQAVSIQMAHFNFYSL